MTIASLLYPCLSVFALSGAAPATAQPAEVQEPVHLAVLQDEDQTSEPVEMDKVEIDRETGSVEPLSQPTDLTAAPGPTPVFAGLSDGEVFTKAAEYLQGIDTMKSKFTQIAPSGNVSTGMMQLSRPGRLRFEYDAPNPTLIVATQGLVYVHDSELEDTDSYPVNKTPLKFLLSKEIKTDDARLVAVNRQADAVSLTLESTDEETQGQIVLEFAAPDLQLQRWSVYDPRGGVTVVDLEAPETGVRIANNAFRVPEAGGTFLRDN